VSTKSDGRRGNCEIADREYVQSERERRDEQVELRAEMKPWRTGKLIG
jgi:hypothetical protein